METVSTITRASLIEAQKAAYRLADNRITLNAGWDEALLAAEVAKLQEMGGLDLALTGCVIRSQIVWAKSRFVWGRGDDHWQHEPCLDAVRKGATGHWQGGRK